MKAKMIVLEALDGVGKTTLGQRLATRLNGVFLNTPGTTLRTLSPQILPCLAHDQTAISLFYAASVLAVGHQAKRLVEDGTSVVIDRYWLSTISYARARGVDIDFRSIEESIPQPDVTIALTLNESVRQKRLIERGFSLADRETMEPQFRQTVWKEMIRKRQNQLQPQHVCDVTSFSKEQACAMLFYLLYQQGESHAS